MTQGHSYAVLRLLETPGVGPARVRSLTQLAGNDGGRLSALLEDESRLREVLSDRQIQDLCANEDRVSDEWRTLLDERVRVVSLLDEGYPERLRSVLGKKAPPLLMILGNASLLESPSVSFCGSRKASEKGLATATDCADQLAREGVNIVSGYAAGVDLATHRAALAAGGTTSLLLGEGILQFRIKRELKDLWDWERIAVVSEFLPGLPWSVRNAMQRNQTICALARAMILIESGASGGSMEAGRTCLKLGLPLFAPVYEGMPDAAVGNRELLQHGAKRLLKSRGTGRANLQEVLAVAAPGSGHGAPPRASYEDDRSPQPLLFEAEGPRKTESA